MAVFGAIVGAIVGRMLILAAGGWAFMLGVGVVHAEWLSQVPTIGYQPALVLVSLAYVVLAACRPIASEDRE